ncbi:MAG: bifunctional ornithine acetyltransferase/N-acetylglutamate synthase [Euryarchaeota archaeon]|nr:bifunctional ornithine acetyltransferase/N-acetylglutamate synthase [Euryarchaeota archaeon]
MKTIDGGVTTPLGWKAAGVHCGIKRERLDLAMLYSEHPTFGACAYTQNRMRAAPIEFMIKQEVTNPQAFVINSGNANAITGEQGLKDARTMVELTAKALGIDESLVGVASTGIIGRRLPMEKISAGIQEASKELSRGREADHRAAMAILTTDKVIKEAAVQITLEDGTKITIAGMAKGSGMISPSMKVQHATTLSFVTTDAVLTRSPEMRWQEAIDNSFNVINVDGDQSTNDISVFMANGAAGGPPVDDNPIFWKGVDKVVRSLAKQVVTDGEGATKLIELKVIGAKDDAEARKAGRWIISSSLVKTAVFGADPNFGRILAALGNSGSTYDIDNVRLTLGTGERAVVLFDQGVPQIEPCSEGEVAARKLLSKKRIVMTLDLGVGQGQAEAWGCDLSYEYVKINAEYTS